MLEERNPRELHLMVPVTLQAKSQYFQFPLTVGKEWKTQQFYRGRWMTAENSVIGMETVTTPAGTFPALRIERRVLYSGLNNTRTGVSSHHWLTYIYFYSPQTRSVVKYHFQREDQSLPGDLALDRTVDIELIKRGNTPSVQAASKPIGPMQQKAQIPENIEMQYLPAETDVQKAQPMTSPKDSALAPNEQLALGKATTSPPGAPLTLRMNIIGQRKETDGSYTDILVNDGSVLRSRDNFQVHFETTSPAFIYILLYDSQGKASQLFPDPKIDEPNFVEGGKKIVIPGDNFWFWLDESPGTETVYVIASKKSMSDIKGLLAKMETADDSAQQQASQQIKERIAIMQRGIGGVTKGQTVTYTLSDGKKIQKVTEVVDGTGSVVRAVSFQHK